MSLQTFHIPVLLPQTLEALQVKSGGKYIDATVGGGGYSEEILKLGGIVLGIDRDPDAIAFLLKKYENNKNIFIRQGNFKDIRDISEILGWQKVSGILFDLGMSTHQLDVSRRGFSYRLDEPLDMRMDPNFSVTAEQILNKTSKEELYEIFITFAEELNSRAIVQAIIRARTIEGPIKRTGQLVQIVRKVCSSHKDLNVNSTLARIFQALRIAVNDELTNLKVGLKSAIEILDKQGVLVVLSYHSLEDRIVKQFFLKYVRLGEIRIKTFKPVQAEASEKVINSRARSVKMRIIQKI